MTAEIPPSDWFARAIDNIARGTRSDLSSYLHTVADSEIIGQSHARLHVRWLPNDAHGRPRLAALAERLAEEILDYCIPRSRIRAALDHQKLTGSSSRILRLENEARRLFTSSTTSGEGGELLLYALLEIGLGIPQILCKMPLKTSSDMHIHGVDGVHAIATEDGVAVYWGESKVYADFSSAMAACFDSVAPFLKDDGAGALRRDLQLAREGLDAGSREITLKLAKFFDPDEGEAQKLEMRAACLIGFGLSGQPQPFDEFGALTNEVREKIDGWSSAISSRISKKDVESFHIEVFCVPFETADAFRAAIRTALAVS